MPTFNTGIFRYYSEKNTDTGRYQNLEYRYRISVSVLENWNTAGILDPDTDADTDTEYRACVWIPTIGILFHFLHSFTHRRDINFERLETVLNSERLSVEVAKLLIIITYMQR